MFEATCHVHQAACNESVFFCVQCASLLTDLAISYAGLQAWCVASNLTLSLCSCLPQLAWPSLCPFSHHITILIYFFWFVCLEFKWMKHLPLICVLAYASSDIHRHILNASLKWWNIFIILWSFSQFQDAQWSFIEVLPEPVFSASFWKTETIKIHKGKIKL